MTNIKKMNDKAIQDAYRTAFNEEATDRQSAEQRLVAELGDHYYFGGNEVAIEDVYVAVDQFGNMATNRVGDWCLFYTKESVKRSIAAHKNQSPRCWTIDERYKHMERKDYVHMTSPRNQDKTWVNPEWQMKKIKMIIEDC